MGFRDKKRTPEKKAVEKKVVKQENKKPVIESNRVQKPVEKKIEQPVKEKKVVQKVEKKVEPVIEKPVEKSKTDYYGIGVTGSHPQISLFKGTCKLKNKKVGFEIVEMLKAWNEKNK